MISELKSDDFHKCLGLLNAEGQIEVKAIVNGVNPGRIFVDNLNAPGTGLIWLGNNDGFIFMGDENNEAFNSSINAFIDDVIVPEARRSGLEWFEGSGHHPGWDKTLERLFEHRQWGSWLQCVYRLEKENYQQQNKPEIPQGYTIHKMDELLYKNDSTIIKNIDFLQSKVSEFWSSPERFFEEGTGYYALYDHEVVGICFSGFVANSVHCIDIETLKAHRGKKLAQLLAWNVVADCFEKNRVPYWDCMEGNKASIAVAESLGFTKAFNYTGYEFSF